MPTRVVELRRYRLRPSARERLIALFEAELVAPQEEQGMRIIAQFRDLDEPDHFVWLRGFDDMAARARALHRFYDGPVWRRHRDAANATMLDSDDVLLLRPTHPLQGNGQNSEAAVFATSVYPVRDDGFLRSYLRDAVPLLAETGAQPRAIYRTEHSPNNFPRLPVRDGENVVVAMYAFASRAAYEQHLQRLEGHPRWRGVLVALSVRLTGEPQTALLMPTEGSRVRR